MDYNTTRDHLILREYGRHIKKIVENCMAIEDREARNKMAWEIIDLMGQLNPHLRNVDDYKHKLWDHLFMISDFKLDVDSPYPKTTKTKIIEKPEPMEYPGQKIKFKHYGKNVEVLVEKAKLETNPEKKAAFAQCIGNYMKLVYQNWNKDNQSDENIKNDLRLLSSGDLVLSETDNINELARSSGNNFPTNNTNNNNKNKNFQHKNKNNQNNNNNQNRNSNGGNGNNGNRPNNNNNNNNNKYYSKNRPVK